MDRRTRIHTAPTGLVVSVADAKLHGHVDSSAEDALVQTMIGTATSLVEAHMRRTVTLTRTLEDVFRSTPEVDEIRLGRGPVTAVSQVAAYADDGTETVLDSSLYGVDLDDGVVYLRDGGSWPLGTRGRSAFIVRYVAGYANGAAVPDAIRQAILQTVGHLYENREGQGSEAFIDGPGVERGGGKPLAGLPPGVTMNLAPFVSWNLED